MADVTLVATDSAPSINGTLTEEDGSPLNLTGATVRFQMRMVGDGRFVVDSPAVVVGVATAGIVRYDWDDDPIPLPGDYLSRWQVTYADTTVQHSEPENTITVDLA